jgi:hypothetical protein
MPAHDGSARGMTASAFSKGIGKAIGDGSTTTIVGIATGTVIGGSTTIETVIATKSI